MKDGSNQILIVGVGLEINKIKARIKHDSMLELEILI